MLFGALFDVHNSSHPIKNQVERLTLDDDFRQMEWIQTKARTDLDLKSEAAWVFFIRFLLHMVFFWS